MTDTGALEVGGDKNADGGWELADGSWRWVGWVGAGYVKKALILSLVYDPFKTSK